MTLSVAVYVEARKRNVSPTTRAIIDGDTFTADESATGDFAAVKRELFRMGVLLPDDFDLGEDSLSPSHPAFSGRLSGTSRPSSPKKADVPGGLKAEHSISMKGNGKPVELVFGKIESRGVARSRLETDGWECFAAGEGSNGATVLQKNGGKEIRIVWLDEAEGEFLMVRELGR